MNCQRAPNPPEFAQPRLSRVKRRSSPARGYKFGCVCSYMAGITQVWAYKFVCVCSVSFRPHFALLKRGCANSGGFGARWNCAHDAPPLAEQVFDVRQAEWWREPGYSAREEALRALTATDESEIVDCRRLQDPEGGLHCHLGTHQLNTQTPPDAQMKDIPGNPSPASCASQFLACLHFPQKQMLPWQPLLWQELPQAAPWTSLPRATVKSTSTYLSNLSFVCIAVAVRQALCMHLPLREAKHTSPLPCFDHTRPTGSCRKAAPQTPFFPPSLAQQSLGCPRDTGQCQTAMKDPGSTSLCHRACSGEDMSDMFHASFHYLMCSHDGSKRRAG